MLKNFEIKDATMYYALGWSTTYMMDPAKKLFWHIYKTDLREQKEK